MEQAGHGTGMNPTRQDHSFPFIKRLVLGKDSENLNHNCKQKWRKGLGAPIIPSPTFKLAEGPQFSAQYESRSGVSDTFMGPQGAGGLGRSGWCLLPRTKSNRTPGLSEVSVCSPDWSHAQANKERIRRGQTSVPGV